jgi:phage terminase large subunit-like protein
LAKNRKATRSQGTDTPNWRRDYVGIADAYAREAADEANSGRFCKWVRLAARRYLKDRERAANGGPFVWSDDHACDPCDFIEKLPHVEGKWETVEIVLHASDVFFICNLFGFRQADGTRRFSIALKAIARKNAKSTVAAAIALYCETCEDEEGPQVITGATTGTQARIVFNIAKRMVEKTPALRSEFLVEPFANAIVCHRNGATFKPINAKASTQDGLNPSAVVLDEIHAHKNHDLVNVIRSAAGARANPLFLFTTTEGYENAGPWPELRHFARQVLEGIVEADHFLAVYYSLDDEEGTKGEADYRPADNEFDESKWIKANPLLDVNPNLLREIRKEAIEAKQMPGRLAEFRTKRANRRSAAAGAWINIPKWQRCNGKVDLKWLRGYRCHAGLDLSSTSDLTSFRLVWHVDDRYYTHGWRFVPIAAIAARTERGLVPYKGWIDAGYLIEAGDEVINYDLVEEVILEQHGNFQIESVNYDRWNAAQLAAKLVRAGVKMKEFIQGTKSYHPAMKELERAYISGALNVGDDPVLNWCAGNIVARNDNNMNMAPDKRKSPEKIDDMSALIMGIGAYAQPEETVQRTYDLVVI